MLLANGRSNTFFLLNGDPLIRAPESSDAIIEKNLQEAGICRGLREL
jgi:hypothetical protein